MPYVMVPVPEEHVQAFTTGLIRMTMGMAGWDEESVGVLVAGLEGQERTLVLLIAEAAEQHTHLAYRDAARLLGIDGGELLDLVTAINERCRRASFPTLLMTHTHVGLLDSDEPTAVAVLSIGRVVALKVLAAFGASGAVEPAR